MSLHPARNSDPSTSHYAADAMEESGRRRHQQAITVAIVRRWPGRTSAELAELQALMTRTQLARRLPECDELRKGDARKCAVNGTLAVTWWVA